MIEQIQPFLPMLATFLLGLVASIAFWQKLKDKIHALRNFLTTIDDAIYDDVVTEEEFRKIWESAKKIIR